MLDRKDQLKEVKCDSPNIQMTKHHQITTKLLYKSKYLVLYDVEDGVLSIPRLVVSHIQNSYRPECAIDLKLEWIRTSDIKHRVNLTEKERNFIYSVPNDVSYIPNSEREDVWKICRYIEKSSIEHHYISDIHVYAQCAREGFKLPDKKINKNIQFQVSNIPSRTQLMFPHASNILSEFPLLPSNRRKYLFSFTGTIRGAAESVEIRRIIKYECLKSKYCIYSNNIKSFKTLFEIKCNSVYCFEPPGFSSTRKSMSDSVLCGCIPIYFFKSYEIDDFLPLFYQNWLQESSIIIDSDDLKHNHITNLTHYVLQQGNAMAKQTIILKNRHKLLYNVDHNVPSALTIILKSMLNYKIAKPGHQEFEKKTMKI
tara:strand:+ start:111 stop:1217 length:1107 start_codon:yes stop_codon:yes gene_type:complete